MHNTNREVKMKVAGIKPRTGLIWKRDKTSEEIDKELADYDAKMLGRHFIIAYKVFDGTYHFSDEEQKVISAALGNGKGLPKYMDVAYLLATGGDLKRMEIINRMVDLSRERNSNWWLDNIIFPFFTCIRDVYDKIQILVAKSVVVDTYRREICEEITNSAYPDFFYWNKDESSQFGDGYSGKKRRR